MNVGAFVDHLGFERLDDGAVEFRPIDLEPLRFRSPAKGLKEAAS